MAKKLKFTVESLSSTHSFEDNAGYKRGIEDALVTIIKLLSDNNLTLKPKEFYKEYNLLKKEGVI